MSGDGDKSVLKATDPSNSAVTLTGDGASLSNLKSEVDNAGGRSSQPGAANVLVQNARNASVTGVDAIGGASNGIRLDNAQNSTISGNTVQGSNADGIAMMNGSSNNLVKGNLVHQAGDDSISDDSYVGDAKQDENNVIDGNMVLDGKYGRGIAIMGGKNATVSNNIVNGVSGKGIDVGTDANSGTMAGSANVSNNTVVNEFDANSGNATVGTPQAVKDAMGTLPSPDSIIGRPANLVERAAFDAIYQPGTGNGSNNVGGVRT